MLGANLGLLLYGEVSVMRLKIEFTEDEQCHNLMSWLNFCCTVRLSTSEETHLNNVLNNGSNDSDISSVFILCHGYICLEFSKLSSCFLDFFEVSMRSLFSL